MALSFADGLSARDQRALRVGAYAATAVLALALALPIARAWSDREASIALRESELSRLTGLATAEGALAPALALRQVQIAREVRRPIQAPILSAAAAELQATLQRYADESQLTVLQLDVVGATDEANVNATVPATLVATGDVYAVTDLLTRVQHGPLLLTVRELSLQTLAGQRGVGGRERLQLSLVVDAPVITP